MICIQKLECSVWRGYVALRDLRLLRVCREQGRGTMGKVRIEPIGKSVRPENYLSIANRDVKTAPIRLVRFGRSTQWLGQILRGIPEGSPRMGCKLFRPRKQ